jgi:hypothetical protein
MGDAATESEQIDLWCFLHDALLKRTGVEENGVVSLFFELGYPAVEETAYSKLECRITGSVTLQAWPEGQKISVSKDLAWIAEAEESSFIVIQALIDAGQSWTLSFEGHAEVQDFEWFKVDAEGLPPIWIADGHEVSLEEMIAMGERQWNLWSERAEARLQEAKLRKLE